MPWRAIKWNNGAVITDGASYFKVCPDRATAQAQLDAWTLARTNMIPVPRFALAEMNAGQLTGDARVANAARWGLRTDAINTSAYQFYQLSKTNKVNAASTAIGVMPLNARKRIRNILRTAYELHLADTQFFLGADKILFIDIEFRNTNNDANLAALIARLD